MEVIEKDPDESAPVETQTQLPADTTPAPSDDIDYLLEEFNRATAEPKPDSVTDPNVTETPSDLDQQIQDLLGPDPKVAELQGQLGQLQAQMRAAEELKAFNEFAGDLQKQLPDWLPSDYARVKLESLAHDPVARLAWDTRHIDPKAAALDLQHVKVALMRLQAVPNADQAKVRELNTLAYQLNIAANSAAILRQARNMILNEAKKLPPPIDPVATADRDAVAFAVREANHGDIPEPQPQWSTMSNAELREYTMRKWGFAAGV